MFVHSVLSRYRHLLIKKEAQEALCCLRFSISSERVERAINHFSYDKPGLISNVIGATAQWLRRC